MDTGVTIAITSASSGILYKLIAIWERRQQYKREDAKALRDSKERLDVAAIMAKTVKTEADRVEQVTTSQTAQIVEKLDLNTQLTQTASDNASYAYAAGNDTSTKFLKLHARHDREDSRLDEHDRQLAALTQRG